MGFKDFVWHAKKKTYWHLLQMRVGTWNDAIYSVVVGQVSIIRNFSRSSRISTRMRHRNTAETSVAQNILHVLSHRTYVGQFKFPLPSMVYPALVSLSKTLTPQHLHGFLRTLPAAWPEYSCGPRLASSVPAKACTSSMGAIFGGQAGVL